LDFVLRSSESSRSTDARFTAHAEDTGELATKQWDQAVVNHHFVFSLTGAVFSVTHDVSSGKAPTLIHVFGMDLAQRFSATGVSDWSIARGTEFDISAASGHSWLSASWGSAFQA
tara:strand:- start:273 stop:617 length:345 start_codon:yes stop_codon:yes gene_type:complete